MISKKERSYFNAAKAMSHMSDHRCLVGCVLVMGHKIIGSGYNSNTKCHRVQAEIDQKRHGVVCAGKVHAEVDTLIPFLKRRVDLSNATLYIYRSKRDGTYGLARPCSGCMEIIKQCGIKKIAYSTDDGFAKEILMY